MLNGTWALDKSVRDTEFAFIVAAIKNGNLNDIESHLAKEKVRAFATADMKAVDQYELSNANLPDNSVAVIYVQGTLYSWKTFDIENYIQQAINNPRIVSILLFVNTPGGMVHRLDIASNLIKQSPKPIDAYVTGLCCSGGMWLVSACRTITAASPMDIFGSIGVKTNYYSLKKYLEDLGIVDKDIYATDSVKKDYESRELESNNEKPLIEALDFTNNIFQQTIATNRGIALDKSSEVFQGAVFNSQKAIELRLADKIGTLEDALKGALDKGLATKSNSIY